jgi:hypothetical protein
MPAALALFAAKYWKPLLIAAAIAAAIGWRAVLVGERDHARAQATRAQAEAAALHTSNAALSAALARQTAAVEAMRTRAGAQARAQSARAASAARAGAAASGRAGAQARSLVAAPIGAGCDAAIRWGNARAPELSRW